jgi:hypothetical protein
VDFVSRRGGRLFLLGLGFLPLRLVWLGTMMLAMFAPLSLAPHLAAGWVLLLMAAIALIYFAGADLLHLARLGAYASLAEDDAHPVPAPEASNPPDPALAPEPDSRLRLCRRLIRYKEAGEGVRKADPSRAKARS